MTYILYRDINKPKPEKVRKVTLSRFRPRGFKTMLLSIPRDHIILGVTYSKDGDNQIFISGHPHKSETIEEGALREMKEELCLTTAPENMKESFTVGDNTFYSVDIDDCRFVKNSMVMEYGDDDPKRRAILCVHGSRPSISNYMYNLNYSGCNEDGIGGIWSADAQTILKMLKK